jgi:hypothetical protein
MTNITALIFSAPIVLLVIAAWHLAEKYLTNWSTGNAGAVQQLESIVKRHETAVERNELALKNFLTQILELTNQQERSRREAMAQAAQNPARKRGF